MKAFVRTLFWSVPGVLLSAIAWTALKNASLTPSAVTSRLVVYSIVLLFGGLALIGALCAFQAMRWLLLACWPGRVEIIASENQLILRLGSFGVRTYDVERIESRYPFEIPEELNDAGFEDQLPVDQQLAVLLPRLTHPESPTPLNPQILRFGSGSESEVAAALRPAIERWRPADREGAGGETNKD